jgi:cytidylate kinase
MVDAQKLIQSLVRSEYLKGRQDKPGQARPVVTLSRDLGAGGAEVARLLGARLKVEVWDRRLLDAVAESTQVSAELLSQLDERVRSRKDSWIYNLLSNQSAFMTTYRHHLVNVSLALAQTGGIIVGRGVHLILANRPVFRVRLVGSEGACAARVAARDGITPEAAVERVRTVNSERDNFLQTAFGHRLEEAARFDLVLNTDKFGARWDSVTDLIVAGMKAVELPVSAGK